MDLTDPTKQKRLQQLIFRAKVQPLNVGEKREFSHLIGGNMKPIKPKLTLLPS